jgi:hypothetical protein
MTRRRSILRGHAATTLLFTICLGALAPTIAAAEGDAEAEQLFRDGKKLMDEKRYAEACIAFETSQRLDAALTTLVNLANCREKNGQLQSAWIDFLDVERRTRGDRKQAALNKTAKQRADALEPRLSYLTVSVPADSNVDGLQLSRDGLPFDPGLWNRAIPVDGGSYVIGGRAPGHEEWSTTVTVPTENGHISVDVPKFKEVEKLVPAVAAAEPAADSDDEDDEYDRSEPSAFTGRRKLALGVGAGGLVAVGAGIVFGLQASGMADDATALCPAPTGCTRSADANALIARAQTRAIVADVAYGVGAAAVITAAVLWFTGAPALAVDDDTALLPTVTSSSAGLAVAGRF